MRALLSTRERCQQRSGSRKPQASSLIGSASTVSTQDSLYWWAARGPRASKLLEPEKLDCAKIENNNCFLLGFFFSLFLFFRMAVYKVQFLLSFLLYTAPLNNHAHGRVYQ